MSNANKILPNPRLEKMAFDYETTARTDYQTPSLYSTKTEYQQKGVCYRIRPPPLKYLHTMTDWRVPNLPFNMFLKNVDNPYKPQMPYYKEVDHEREHVQRTRPRLVMTPAEVLDDLKEPGRTSLVNNVYKTTTTEQMREPIDLNLRVKAPLPTKNSATIPITLRKLNAPFVSPEWRMDSVMWDNKCHRAYTPVTREFWLRGGHKKAGGETRNLSNLTPNKENATSNEGENVKKL